MPEIYSTYYAFPQASLKISGTKSHIIEISFRAEKPPFLENGSISPTPPVIKQCISELTAYFNGDRRIFEVPIHQEGTEFQKRVWNELLLIPFGKSISYLELARHLGDVKVIRAAASANGKNKIAIVVPCHRVIGSNNALVGYAGGLSNKRWLLEHEAKMAHGVQALF